MISLVTPELLDCEHAARETLCCLKLGLVHYNRILLSIFIAFLIFSLPTVPFHASASPCVLLSSLNNKSRGPSGSIAEAGGFAEEYVRKTAVSYKKPLLSFLIPRTGECAWECTGKLLQREGLVQAAVCSAQCLVLSWRRTTQRIQAFKMRSGHLVGRNRKRYKCVNKDDI